MAQQHPAYSMSLEDLTLRCAAETESFFRHDSQDSQFCFELFRRALAENNQRAWEQIYLRFGTLVAGWAGNHPGIDGCDGEIQEYVNLAFQRLWAAASAAKFDDFQSLPSLLAYLKMCVHSAIIDDVRRSNRTKLLQAYDVPSELKEGIAPHSDSTPEQQYMEAESSKAVWDAICARLHDEKERLVIYCQFVLGLKPKTIVAQHGDQFSDVSEIYRIRQVVLERLSRDPVLEQIWRA